MEFSGFGTIQPIQGVSESDVQNNREIEGGWFISGPAQFEMMEQLRSQTRQSQKDKARGFQKKVRANLLVHRTRLKIISKNKADPMEGNDPREILDRLKSLRRTTTAKAALELLDDPKWNATRGTSINSSIRGSKRSHYSHKPSDILGCPARLVTLHSPELDRTGLPSIHSGDFSECVSKTEINSGHNRSALRSRTSLAPSFESLKSGGLGKSPAKKSSKAKVLDLDRPSMPLMSKQDVARYRNSISQNVCQDMLMKGFHRAFAEIFNMVRQNREARDASGPDSSLRHMSLLEHSPRKLEKIKKGLESIEEMERTYDFHRSLFRDLEEVMLTEEPKSMAMADRNVMRNDQEDEDASDGDDEEEAFDEDEGLKAADQALKKGSSVWHRQFTLKGMKHPYVLIFETRYDLGIYFNSIDDFWCSHYFFETALETAKKIPGPESGQKIAECSRAYGRSLENHGFYEEAAIRLEEYLSLTKQFKWASDDGRSLEKDAYIQLSRIYNLIANQMIRRTRDVEGEKNPKDEALNYFHKSYTVAYKAGDRTIESLASYKLGMMLLFSGYPRKCLKYLEVYLYFCQINGNDFGMARALEGIGRALHEQGDNYLAMGYLTKFEEIILRKRKQAIKAITTSQWRCDNVERFIETVRYHILEGSFVRCSRLIGAIYDDQRNYDKSEPFLQNSYQVAKVLREKDDDRYSCARVQYGISVAHHLWSELAQMFEHNDWDVRKKLDSAKMMTNWRLNRITGFCRPGDNLNPDEMDYKDDLEIIEGEEAYQEERTSVSMFASYLSTAGPSTTSNDPALHDGKAAVDDEERKRLRRIAKAKFIALERERASKASTKLGQYDTLGSGETAYNRESQAVGSIGSTSTRDEPQPLVGMEGPKLPVREKAHRERWSALELVPEWYSVLDINFVDEYGLMGNCLRAGFHPFMLPRDITYGKVKMDTIVEEVNYDEEMPSADGETTRGEIEGEDLSEVEEAGGPEGLNAA